MKKNIFNENFKFEINLCDEKSISAFSVLVSVTSIPKFPRVS